MSPKLPTWWPSYVEPSASQQSSIRNRLLSFAICRMGSRSNGFPRVCATMIALVLGPTASATAAGSILYVPISTSTKTGVIPQNRVGLTVVGNPVAAVITSSPGLRRRFFSFLDVSAEKATRLAEDPELTVMASFVPTRLANLSSNPSLKRPVANQKSEAHPTTAPHYAPPHPPPPPRHPP